MAPPKKSITFGAVCTVLGILAGGFLQWSITERRLSIHIATADDRVSMMCVLTKYLVTAQEAVCEANGLRCPPPVDLQPQVLDRRCK